MQTMTDDQAAALDTDAVEFAAHAFTAFRRLALMAEQNGGKLPANIAGPARDALFSVIHTMDQVEPDMDHFALVFGTPGPLFGKTEAEKATALRNA